MVPHCGTPTITRSQNGGFVAFAVEGSYTVLDVVDQTHLPTIVRDPVCVPSLLNQAFIDITPTGHEGYLRTYSRSKNEVHWRREARLHSSFIVSIPTLPRAPHIHILLSSLDIPANNCAVLQRGDDLEQVGAGQHCITNPNVTLRGLFTCGENQIEMPTKDIFTRDQVPVALTIYLKW